MHLYYIYKTAEIVLKTINQGIGTGKTGSQNIRRDSN